MPPKKNNVSKTGDYYIRNNWVQKINEVACFKLWKKNNQIRIQYLVKTCFKNIGKDFRIKENEKNHHLLTCHYKKYQRKFIMLKKIDSTEKLVLSSRNVEYWKWLIDGYIRNTVLLINLFKYEWLLIIKYMTSSWWICILCRCSASDNFSKKDGWWGTKMNLYSCRFIHFL